VGWSGRVPIEAFSNTYGANGKLGAVSPNDLVTFFNGTVDELHYRVLWMRLVLAPG